MVVDGAVVPDAERRMPGRGASVHPTFACVNAAVRRRAFARALRQPVTDLGALTAIVADEAPGHDSAREDTGPLTG